MSLDCTVFPEHSPRCAAPATVRVNGILACQGCAESLLISNGGSKREIDPLPCEVELGLATGACARPATGLVHGVLACRICAECRIKQTGGSPTEIVPLVPPEKWLKKDIRTLCGMLDTFYLVNRPLDHRGRAEYLPKVRALLADWSMRKDIVLGGIRDARARCSRSYSQCCETIGNQIVRFTEYGKPDELIERFTKLAREEDKAEKMLEKMLHRVLDEGLPPEVEAYDPTAERTR